MKPARVPVTLVCGPPGSGKSTWAINHVKPGGVVIDLDTIIAELAGRRTSDRYWVEAGLRERNRRLALLSTKKSPATSAILIVSEATPERREWWVRKLGVRQVVVLEVPADICMERVKQRQRERLDSVKAVIDEWWRRYRRRPADLVLGPDGTVLQEGRAEPVVKNWQHLYNSPRWRRGLRIQQLNAEPLCRMCAQMGRNVPATVVDHVIPHKGDLDAFWHGELQSLCDECHNRHKQSQEKGGTAGGFDSNGYPLS